MRCRGVEDAAAHGGKGRPDQHQVPADAATLRRLPASKHHRIPGVPPSTATHRKAKYPGQVLCLDKLGPIGPTGHGYPYVNIITNLCTGAAIATNSLKNKAQTALVQEMCLRRAHRATAPLGGTQGLELDMGLDFLTNRTKVFAESQKVDHLRLCRREPTPTRWNRSPASDDQAEVAHTAAQLRPRIGALLLLHRTRPTAVQLDDGRLRTDEIQARGLLPVAALC